MEAALVPSPSSASAARTRSPSGEPCRWRSRPGPGRLRLAGAAATSRTSECLSAEADARALARTWEGFGGWRAAPLREDVAWGELDSEPGCAASGEGGQGPAALEDLSLSEVGKLVLETSDPLAKADLTHRAHRAFEARGTFDVGRVRGPAPNRPGRPRIPHLVPPRECPSPKDSGLPLPVYMLHNLAHIELNAIDLAWDTVVSFSAAGLPRAFYADFLRVADDESRHLGWCLQRLSELGSFYGAMPAHDLLWRAGLETRGDLLGRLVAVPMVQEARGLDAGPRLVKKLEGAGDARSADIVRKIALEERAHVAVGVYWFRYCCGLRGVAEEEMPAEFQRVASEFCGDMIRGPFDMESRRLVGLIEDWFAPIAAA